MIRSVLACLLLCALAIPAAVHAQNNTISTVAGGGAPTGGPSGPATSAQVITPSGLALDGNGNIYIGSNLGSQVLLLSAGGNISVFAGTSFSASTANGGTIGDGGPATSASFLQPIRVALDAAGNLYVADFAGFRIRKISTAGTITTVAGTGLPCPAPTQACGDGGPATQATFISPETLAIDAAGDIFVSGAQEQRVRRIDAVSGNISTVVGTGNPCTNPTATPACGDGGSATSATLSGVRSLAFDPTGNLYIGDTGAARIRRVDKTTQVITTYAGNGMPCTVAPCGDNGPATSGQVFPLDITFDANGNLFTVQGTTLREVDAATQTLTTLSGQGATQGFGGDGGPASQAFLNGAFAVRVDAAGNIYIGDTGNNRVRKVTPANLTITTIAGGGNGLSAGGEGPEALLGLPIGVAVDSTGDVFFADFAAGFVRELNTENGIQDIAGNGLALSAGNGGPALSASLTTNGNNSTPAIDSQGDVYISDVAGDVVRLIVAESGQISTFAGNGIVCDAPTNACGDGAIALQAHLNGPSSVALDASGGLLIADGNDFRVRRVDPTTGNMEAFAGTGGICANPTTACGDGGPALQATFSPAGFLGLAVSGSTTFIADAGAVRVRAVDANGTIATVAGNGMPCANPSGACGDGGAATAANLNFPSAVAVDGKGNLFIADVYKIRRVDAVDGTIATVAGNGTLAYAGDGGASTAASIGATQGVAVDANENLYLSDQLGNRIRTVPLAEVQTLTGTFNSFGQQGVGTTSSPQSITLGNTGLASLVISSITLSDPTDFTTTNNCPGQQAAPQQTCAISVTFNPTETGSSTATLTVTTNDATTPTTTLMLQGTGVNGAAANAFPATLTFASQAVGTNSATQTVTLQSTGTTAIAISSIALSGANASSFSQTNNCPAATAMLAQQATCAIQVTYTPAAAGAATAALTITDSAANSPQTVTLTGTGTGSGGGGVSFNTNSVNFGSIPVVNVIVQDQGGTDPNTLGFMGAFGGTAPGSAANGMWDIPAGPWNTNYDQYNLTTANLTDLNAASGYIFTATFNDLSTNTQPTYPGAPYSYGEDADVGVNNLRYDLGILSDGEGDQVLVPNPFDANSPTATIPGLGTNPATLTLVFNNTTQLANFYVNGVQVITGYAGDSAAYTCNCVVFGGELGDFSNVELIAGLPTAAATVSVTLTNPGTAPLTFTVPATITGPNAGDFTFAPGSTCAFGTPVPAGGTCLVNLLFLPTAAGVRNATLTFFDSATPNTQTIALTGNGTAASGAAPVVQLSTNSVTFPATPLNTTTSPMSVTVFNNGNATLSFTNITIAGANAGDFSLTESTTCNTDGGSAVADNSCTLAITFTPSAAGNRTATLTLTDNATPATQTIALSGTGGVGTLVLTPPTTPVVVSVGQLIGFPITVSVPAGSTATVTFTTGPLPAGVCIYYPRPAPSTVTGTQSLTFLVLANPQSGSLGPHVSPPTSPITSLHFLRSVQVQILLLLGLLLGLVFAGRRGELGLVRRPRFAVLIPLLLLAGAAVSLTSCGGTGSSTATNSGTTLSSATPGTYQITITGTTANTSQSTVFTLQIQ